MIACANSLSIIRLPNSAPHLKLISVQIKLSPTSFILFVLYIPPSATPHYFSDILDHLYHLFSSSKLPIFVVGDINCPDLHWPTLSASPPTSAINL